MKTSSGVAIVALVLVASGGWFYFAHQDRIEQRVAQLSVPAPVSVSEVTDEAVIETDVIDPGVLETDITDESVSLQPTNTNRRSASGGIPNTFSFSPSFNLAIPFTSQAPHKNWDMPYQEACEEASVLMAVAFLKPELVNLSSADESDSEILSLVDFQTRTLGKYEDTTVDETVSFAEAKFPDISFEVVNNPSVEFIKSEIAKGHPVIVPADGKRIQNPNFSNGGPVYHMLVLRGYTEKTFIANDPGTRLGEGYVYKITDIMDVMGDWNGGHPESGAKRVIVVK